MISTAGELAGEIQNKGLGMENKPFDTAQTSVQGVHMRLAASVQCIVL